MIVGQPSRQRSPIKHSHHFKTDSEGQDTEDKVAEGQDDEDHEWLPDEELNENPQGKPACRNHLLQHCLRGSNITTECASIIQSFANDDREEWDDAELNLDGTVHSSNGLAVRLRVVPTRALSYLSCAAPLVYMCVCVCVRERERARERECVRVCV